MITAIVQRRVTSGLASARTGMTNTKPTPLLTKLSLLVGLACVTTFVAPAPDAVASTGVSAIFASMVVIPREINGEWFKLQSSWKEQCSATLFIQTETGAQRPSHDASDYTKIVRGVSTALRPEDNGGNDGDFYWKCGNSYEHSDVPGNDFHTLVVKHSDTSREIVMNAYDKCGNGTTVQQCF